MYYPKNQIQTGFYSNGELIEARSKQLYTGPYFKTSDGLFYSGKEPNEGKNIVLIYPEDSPGFSRTQLSNRVEIEDYRFTRENAPYSILSGQNRNTSLDPDLNQNIPIPPVPTYQVNGVEFTKGEFINLVNQASKEDLENKTFKVDNDDATFQILVDKIDSL